MAKGANVLRLLQASSVRVPRWALYGQILPLISKRTILLASTLGYPVKTRLAFVMEAVVFL